MDWTYRQSPGACEQMLSTWSDHFAPFAAGSSHFLHEGDDAQHIGADQHSETANGNGEVDLIHGDPRKRPVSTGCDSRKPLLTRTLSSDPSHKHGSSTVRTAGEASEKRPTGATPATSSCNCRLAGPVPLRLSALRAIGLALPQNDGCGHRTLVSRYPTEGGSHSTIGMV
jgi:hypothetical protein